MKKFVYPLTALTALASVQAADTAAPPESPPQVRVIHYDRNGTLAEFRQEGYQGSLLPMPDGSRQPQILENYRLTRYRADPQRFEMGNEEGGLRFQTDREGRLLERLEGEGLKVAAQRTRATPSQAPTLKVADPDRGVLSMTSSIEGRPLTLVDGNQTTSRFGYQGTRLTNLDLGGETEEYRYGGMPSSLALNSAKNAQGGWTLNYGQHNGVKRLQMFERTIGTVAQQQQFSYDGLRLVRHAYPSWRGVNFVWRDNRIVSMAFDNRQPLLSDIEYHPNGEPKSWTWPNGKTWRSAIDAGGRPLGVTLGDYQETVRYDDANRTQTIDTGQGLQRYRYAANGALVEAAIGDTLYQYRYDSNGNRREQHINGNALIYAYGFPYDSNRAKGFSGVGSQQSWRYDGIGNRLGDVAETYNRANRLVRYGDWQYGYGPDGVRLSKRGPDGVETRYLYGVDGKLLAEYAGTALSYELFWFADRPVALMKQNKLYLVMSDHLKTPRQIVDATSSKVVWNWPLDEPFGASQPDEDPDGDGQKFVFNLRFPGHYYDAESQRHYAFGRYYDPASGRYLQAKPWQAFETENAYAYAQGSPLLNISPKGIDSRAANAPARIRLGKPRGGDMVTTTGQLIHAATAGARPLLASNRYRSPVDLTPATPTSFGIGQDAKIEGLRASILY